MSHLLQAQNVSVSFDGLHALSNVNLDIPPAKVSGLIGPNGAGKTTLVNVLTGFQAPTQGTVRHDGQDVSGMPAHKLRRLGVARTFQGGRLFKELSVLDNLEVTGVGLGLSRRAAAARAVEMLDWVGITPLMQLTAGSLPYTDERRVGIARALMLEPKFLLLDEPAAGMSAHEADELSELIGRIVAEIGCGVLLIEHNIGLVLKTCAHIHVLDSGEMIDEGDPAHIKSSEKVLHAYMGTQADIEGDVEAAL
ncbi:ABC transporter ATP-binding protein [Roseovarius faecimaris]|uniref:ABC transporter ATP-binding protein n=1 Tax=Roseovarius faecimaris TaxID=2494550 RepID=A0A6I6INH8_9RHOB|nr:ABC transporter ATP-binding protein [Roseovarius faecimaris]QGX97077.1 ABC transporter ATP-binding protein [Roseovarius faecimaris]